MKHIPRGAVALSMLLTSLASLCILAGSAVAAEPRVPASIEAGKAFSIPLEGSGQATFYLIGPDHVIRRGVNLGSDLPIESSDVRAAGRYQVIICDSSCDSATFEVTAAHPDHVSFFLHPSRVPVSSPGSIDAFAFVFDPFFNLVMKPVSIDFRVTPANSAAFDRRATTRDGVSWIRMDSTPREGRVQVTTAVGKVEEARVIQQVAADACGLRMKAIPNGTMVILETDPVRDCSGNPLPDGTVVSFTMQDRAGKTTVDTPIKKGVARTQFSIRGPAQISVACGVVLGNELALSGKS